jgi:hypothetical protein
MVSRRFLRETLDGRLCCPICLAPLEGELRGRGKLACDCSFVTG